MAINIRSTSLETFAKCPYLYKFRPPFDWAWFLKFGTMVHKYIEMELSGTMNADARTLLFTDVPVWDRDMCIKMSEKICEYVREQQRTLVISEIESIYTYDDVELHGTFDLLFKDKDGNFILWDIKTASNNWTDLQREHSRQKIYYPTLVSKTLRVPIKQFCYLIVTKRSDPQLYPYIYDVQESDQQRTEEEMSKFRKASETNVWTPAEYWTLQDCMWCKLKNMCRNYTPF